jgi:hypothetical protein
MRLLSLLKLSIVALIVYATWQAGSAYWVFFQFRDELQQIALFSAGQSEEQLKDRALEIAYALQLTIHPEQVSVRRENNHTRIDASYKTEIEILPRYRHPWEFEANIDALSVPVPR